MKPWRYRQLLLIFSIALMFFLPLRWDSQTWLKKTTHEWLQRLPFSLETGDMQVSGFGVLIHDVSIKVPQSAQVVTFSEFRAGVDWQQLWQGHLQAVRLQWQGDAGRGQCSWWQHDGYSEIQAIDANIPVSWLQQVFALPLPVRLLGDLAVQGSASFYANQPASLALKAQWQQAVAAMGDQPWALGDFQLQLDGLGQQQPWRWQLNGGEMLKVNGQGSSQPLQQSWQNWPLSGTVQVKALAQSPLAAMLGQMQKITVSGTLAQPQLAF